MSNRAVESRPDSPFHAGELAVQARLGVREGVEPWARKIVRPYLPQQHREFYAQLPFVVAAARDAAGRPWVTLLTGRPGFLRSPDPGSLVLDSGPVPGDALQHAFTAGADVGLLGIDLETRRRNRVNGRITETGANGLRFEVGQSFGNCPQYITERAWSRVEQETLAPTAAQSERLDAEAQSWIRGADTFFIASGYTRDGAADDETQGMDASHRGGPPGFVKVVSDSRLVFPDYAGNNHFNTIGNLVLDPRVGLLFIDFENGALLQVAGRATIDWDSPAVAEHPGAQRLVVVDVERVVRLDDALPLRFSEAAGAVRSLRLINKRRESEDVVSFEFVSRDGGALPAFTAGQHLPLEFVIDGQRVTRTYSLSGGPGRDGAPPERYRISVKREAKGLVSRYLHDRLEVGAVVGAKRPAGDFVVADGERPVALISAGIGVTPMVSMLHGLAQEGDPRDLFFVHGVRDGAHHPLADEIRQLGQAHGKASLTTVYSRPGDGDIEANTDDGGAARSGHVDADLLAELIPGLDADFYLCGPPAFLAEVAASLEARGVLPQRIRSETF